MEDEQDFQNYLSQNCTAAIVSENQVLRALNLPPAPDGYKYDMSTTPPELVKKTSTKPKAKPTMQEEVDLVRCKYGSALQTNDTY